MFLPGIGHHNFDYLHKKNQSGYLSCSHFNLHFNAVVQMSLGLLSTLICEDTNQLNCKKQGKDIYE